MAFPPRKPSNGEEGVDAWLMTYADMITLIMCFFVIFLAISKPAQEKVEETVQAMKEMFGDSKYDSKKKDTPHDGGASLLPGTSGILRDMNAILSLKSVSPDSVTVEKTGKGLNIELNSASFFESGSSDLNDKGKAMLNDIAGTLSQFAADYLIIIEGHTDDEPISSSRFPSNWELSTGRAITVLHFFALRGIGYAHMRVAGYADTEPKVPNKAADGTPIPENRAKNRRVVIKLERLP